MSQARKELRRLQLDLGHTITPRISIVLGNEWAEVVGKGEEEMLNWVRDVRERLTPMKR